MAEPSRLAQSKRRLSQLVRETAHEGKHENPHEHILSPAVHARSERENVFDFDKKINFVLDKLGEFI